jgi:polysaccharide deacetylase family protein (PEP-CTERM system associated)
LLALFDGCDVRGTFFVLGWVAERYPKLVRRIVEAGHELASHGYWHQLVYDLTPEEFAKDIADSKEAIANATGVVVTAYRAPSFSITKRSMWALQILAEQGFEVDSSIFPIRGHDRYGHPDAPKEIHAIETGAGVIQEFPPSAWTRGRMNVPIGGGYFRLFPLSLTLRAIKGVRRAGRPAMFYIHPWEIDPQQPRVKNVKMKNKFRHYVNVSRTERRLHRLLIQQPFAPMSTVIQAAQPVAK